MWKHNPNDQNSLCSERLEIIYQDNIGDTWIGTPEGLSRILAGSDKILSYYHNSLDSHTLGNNHITAIIEDDHQNLWVGTRSGLNKFNPARDQIQRISRQDIDGSTTTIPFDVAFLALEQRDVLWIGHRIGGNAYRWNLQTNEFVGYNLGNSQFDIQRDTSGSIWIASQSGLHKFDPMSDRFETLVDYSVFSIVADRDDNLWAYSISSVLEIAGNGDITEYETEALRKGGNMTGKVNGFLNPDGSIILGDNFRYYYFDPKRIQKSPDTSKLYFTDMAVADNAPGTRRRLPLSFNSINKFNLQYSENSFYLRFTEIDYREKSKSKIQYKLESYDPDWRQTYSEEEISYSNIPVGEYIFQIRASNSSSNHWAQKELYLTISPPWWKTNLAYFFYGLIFIGVLMIAVRWQKRRLLRLEREKAQERELEQAKEIEKAYTKLKATQAQLIQSEKMASLGELTAGIAHEIQNPLNFVNNFSEVSNELINEAKEELRNGEIKETEEILDDLTRNLVKINHHGQRASSIVKSMLDHSRTSAGERVSTDINNLCDEYLRLAYHGMRAKDKSFKVEIKMDLDPSLPRIDVVPQDIGRLILNLVNNAFQAVTGLEKPTVMVKTKMLGDQIEIRVIDNGLGISEEIQDKIFQPFFTTKPTGQGTGLGLSLSYDIVKAHGGELKVESKEGEGSRFIIELPIV